MNNEITPKKDKITSNLQQKIVLVYDGVYSHQNSRLPEKKNPTEVL